MTRLVSVGAGTQIHAFNRSQQTFSIKGPTVNILGFVGHTFSVATLTSVLTAQKQMTHKQMGVGCVLLKLYLHKQAEGSNLPPNNSLLYFLEGFV